VIQAFAGWIKTQLLRESFDVAVHFIVEQVAHKAAIRVKPLELVR
jgi:hypothetical protein